MAVPALKEKLPVAHFRQLTPLTYSPPGHVILKHADAELDPEGDDFPALQELQLVRELVLYFPVEHVEQDVAVLVPLLLNFPVWQLVQLEPETYWPEGHVTG